MKIKSFMPLFVMFFALSGCDDSKEKKKIEICQISAKADSELPSVKPSDREKFYKNSFDICMKSP